MNKIDLSGQWNYGYSPNKSEGVFVLPGSACENKIGTKQTWYEDMNKDTVRCLRPKYNYVGALYLWREVDIPQQTAGKRLSLFMERVNISSTLWIDGKKIGRKITELSAPHVYDLTSEAVPGKHVFMIKIDNTDILNLGLMSSGYSIDTQSIWLGIIGRIELRIDEVFNISNIQVYPDINKVKIKLTLNSDCSSPDDRRDTEIKLLVKDPEGVYIGEQKYNAVMFTRRQTVYLEYPIPDPKLWDEFNSNLYTLECEYIYRDSKDVKSLKFGMRHIRTEGKDIILNNKRIMLRGTLDCGIYPITGYPPMEIEEWIEIMKSVKEYGLNHVRFHAWCPPEAAFEAADLVGVYVSAEMPLWLNKDVCEIETGDDPVHRMYFSNEARLISKYYGNHPSFIMFSCGNELLGDFELLEDIIIQVKAFDNRRLYTLTSNFDRVMSPYDDYFNAFDFNGNKIRLQNIEDNIKKENYFDYSHVLKQSNLPVISFEVGQYCVYPQVDSVNDFSGNLMPVNFDVIGKHMKNAGLYPMLDKYIYASGKTAALFYKEDIEAVMRTDDMTGFQLLGIHDYTGQCTATVGILDVFRKNKGFISANEWREFCSPSVPLLSCKRAYYNDEILEGEVKLYDYGDVPSSGKFVFKLYCGERLVIEKNIENGKVKVDLAQFDKPSKLMAVLETEAARNSWEIFVYPKQEIQRDIKIYYEISDEFKQDILHGIKAVMIMNKDNLKNAVKGTFVPVFWSPAYFPSDNACGAIINNTHPLFEKFPTNDFAGFEWSIPLENSVAMNISGIENINPIIEPVPNFYTDVRRSPLFEFKIGNSCVLFCGFDFDIDDITVQALKNAVFSYVSSDKFKPQISIDIRQIEKMFK